MPGDRVARWCGDACDGALEVLAVGDCSRDKAGGARCVVMARASHARMGNDARYCVWACNRSLSSLPGVAGITDGNTHSKRTRKCMRHARWRRGYGYLLNETDASEAV
jgi:hypothetical protein